MTYKPQFPEFTEGLKFTAQETQMLDLLLSFYGQGINAQEIVEERKRAGLPKGKIANVCGKLVRQFNDKISGNSDMHAQWIDCFKELDTPFATPTAAFPSGEYIRAFADHRVAKDYDVDTAVVERIRVVHTAIEFYAENYLGIENFHEAMIEAQQPSPADLVDMHMIQDTFGHGSLG